ncbi:MAG: FAD:protein FMN transferase [Thermoanaerobaculia bacterium]|nr:FAD:protein FMN transferase [Thermoanaerobaculia bacterium]
MGVYAVGLFYFGILVGCGSPTPSVLSDGRGSSPTLIVVSGPTMGTSYSVKVVFDDIGSNSGALSRDLTIQIERVLDGVDEKMSTWKPESEVSRFNRVRDLEPFPVSRHTLEVVTLAQNISEASGGAFDITVSPLVDAWGFGPPGELPTAPSHEALELLRTETGYGHLSVREEQIDAKTHRFLVKEIPGLEIDLSAIAKGFAVDLVAEELAAAGYSDFMVEVGGEVRTAGVNSSGIPWRIAIEHPVVDFDGATSPAESGFYAIVPLSGLAMATSGDYRNYHEVEGRRVSHTIDPRTARPIEHRLASVSVVMPRCAAADAWATALTVLGEEGVGVAEKLDLAALFLFRQPDGSFRQRATPAFARLLEPGQT